jgi:hypothetical protein
MNEIRKKNQNMKEEFSEDIKILKLEKRLDQKELT